MGTQRFTPEFKEEAVHQITERGYSVADVSERLSVSAYSLYKWLRSVKPDNSVHQAQDLLDARTEIFRLKHSLIVLRRNGYSEKGSVVLCKIARLKYP